MSQPLLHPESCIIHLRMKAIVEIHNININPGSS